MKIIFLGTNGWYSTPTGDTPCILVDAKENYLVLDAGNGIYKLDQYIKEEKPISLFVTHFHLDHTSGLHILPKFEFKQGIDVYVGKGRLKDFQTLVNPPFTIGYKPKPENVTNLKMEVRLQELSEDGKDSPFKMYAIEQFHAYKNHGYRFEIEGKILAYTGDCGYTDATIKLSENADVLIAECGNRLTKENDAWGHLDPIQAATLARQAGVKKLILTHFGATLYTSLDDRKWAEKEAKKIFPNTTAAYDLLEFEF